MALAACTEFLPTARKIRSNAMVNVICLVGFIMMFILFVVVPSPLNSPTQSLNLEWGLERENWEIDMLFTPPGRRSAASMSRQGALPLAYRNCREPHCSRDSKPARRTRLFYCGKTLTAVCVRFGGDAIGLQSFVTNHGRRGGGPSRSRFRILV